jgi:hypothetical protein
MAIAYQHALDAMAIAYQHAPDPLVMRRSTCAPPAPLQSWQGSKTGNRGHELPLS